MHNIGAVMADALLKDTVFWCRFLFSFKKRFGLGLKKFKNRVRVSFCFKVRFNFGIGNLIGGAVGTFGSSLARRLCNAGVLVKETDYGQ